MERQWRFSGQNRKEALVLNRGLIRRLEELETRFVPVTGEPRYITIQYVEKGGNVVDTRVVELPPIMPDPAPRRPRSWRSHLMAGQRQMIPGDPR
jgi:hypothetical protein